MSDPFAGPPGPRPFRILLDEAMRLSRLHFRSIYWPVAIPIAVVSTLISAAQAFWFSRFVEDLGRPGAFFSPSVLVVTFASILLMTVAYNAMQVAVVDALSGRPVDMGRAWRFTLQGRALGTLVIWYACTIASFLLCCFPALYVGPLLAFVPQAMIEEGRFGTQALSRSADLTRYNPSRQLGDSPMVKLFLLFLVGIAISYVLSLLVTLPFQIPMWVDMFRQAASGEEAMLERMPFYMWLQVPAQFLNALASTAVYLYLSCGTALLFFDTRGRKEGLDLRTAIDQVFGGPPPSLPLSGDPTS
jgi:hypothetical protein